LILEYLGVKKTKNQMKKVVVVEKYLQALKNYLRDQRKVHNHHNLHRLQNQKIKKLTSPKKKRKHSKKRRICQITKTIRAKKIQSLIRRMMIQVIEDRKSLTFL
jgi:hypothetical protein